MARGHGRGGPARWWIGTIREFDFSPGPLQLEVRYAKGQLEVGEGGFRHWQIVVSFGKPVRLSFVRKYFEGHWEPTRSEAAVDYVWKDETGVPDTRFELGERPLRRNVAKDWEAIRASAQAGRLQEVPGDIYVRCYNQLSRIACDHLVPVGVERSVEVYWGRTGTGKSRRAWEEAGAGSYAKDPCTKWWCGYTGQECVVIDEFRGQIGISHLLRWFDRYPVCVETKGSARPLQATRFYITSNQSPEEWYPELDEATRLALRRRLTVTHFQ